MEVGDQSEERGICFGDGDACFFKAQGPEQATDEVGQKVEETSQKIPFG